MSSVAPPPRIDRLRDGERRVVLRNIDWATYEILLDRLDGQHHHLTYDRGVLEIMSPSSRHESFKSIAGYFVTEVCVESEWVEVVLPLGETTWKREAMKRGLEADQCFILDPGKFASLAGRLPERPDDPTPDLAIEIEISSSAVDKMAVYAALGVPEVWRCDGETATFEQLGPDGLYHPAEWSRFLPVRPEELLHWLWEGDGANLKEWLPRLRAWARDEVAHRPRPGGA